MYDGLFPRFQLPNGGEAFFYYQAGSLQVRCSLKIPLWLQARTQVGCSRSTPLAQPSHGVIVARARLN